jgi:hypothetical protein
VDYQTLGGAQVVRLFSLTVDKMVYSIALVRTLGPFTRNATSSFIHAADRSGYRFIPVGSFIRSLYVHPPLPKQKFYIINDLIDQDMYLRLKSI